MALLHICFANGFSCVSVRETPMCILGGSLPSWTQIFGREGVTDKWNMVAAWAATAIARVKASTAS